MKDKSRSPGDAAQSDGCIEREGKSACFPGLAVMIPSGSEAHKTLFCRSFIETHRAFEPPELPWPSLDQGTVDRLRAIPFWGAALRAERNAGIMVSGFAQTLSDPLIRQAMSLQGFEESRHARLLQELLRRYDIPVTQPPEDNVDFSERAIYDFAYEECIDSFFGFGIFGLAREVKLFVPELTEIFDYVLQEEARHITFFINWIAYQRAERKRSAMLLQTFATAYGYARAIRRIVTTFAPSGRGAKMQGVGFGAEGAFAMFKGVTWRQFLQACVDENDRYLARMAPDLLRPRVLPTMARLLLSLPTFGRRPAPNPGSSSA
jgi:hypothetical protein